MKKKYRSISYGTNYYAWAYSPQQALSLLQRQALSKVGRYQFNDFLYVLDPSTKSWIKCLY